MDFFRNTVPVVFRERGLTLEDIALFLPALYLPWVLKFLWSIVVEHFHSKKQANELFPHLLSPLAPSHFLGTEQNS